ncbi:MAG: hypothetical protein HY455_03065 [Parcubacteria group bacterium]|nr:hypothetical protein [Parcubacteria group bacterium]
MNLFGGSKKPNNAPALGIDLDQYRGPAPKRNLESRLIGQRIQAHARKHRLPMWQVFRDTILTEFQKGVLTPHELVATAAQCGPDSSHSWTDAVVILYYALGLNPANAREKLFAVWKQIPGIDGVGKTTLPTPDGKGSDLGESMTASAFWNAEIYLGLPTGTLGYDQKTFWP